MIKGNELAQRVKDAVEQMRQTVKEVKHDFETFIVDKSVPLDERWSVWEDAPNELKDHQSWIVRFKNLHDDAIGYDALIRHAERHETVHITDLFESLEECFAEYQEGEPDGTCEWSLRWYKNKKKVFENFDMDALKEEILEMNLGSFEYDW
jgi:hypothetical protein